MKRLAQVSLLFLMATAAHAQSAEAAAQAQDLRVAASQTGVRVEVQVSADVVAQVVLASKPDRIVLELPGVVSGVKQPLLKVNQYGVRTVRIESSSSGSAQVVVTLEKVLPYTLASEGTHIVLTVLPPDTGRSRKERSAPAASAPLIGGLRRPEPKALPDESATTQPPLPDPPALPPIAFPRESGRVVSARAAGDSRAGAEDQRSVASQDASPVQQPPPSQVLPPVTDAASTAGQVPSVTDSPPPVIPTPQPNSDVKVAFRVKYVAEGVAYLDGGQNDGLAEGMKLVVKDADPVSGEPSKSGQTIAELQVESVALSSAVTGVQNPTRPVKVGDWAYLSGEDTQALVTQRSLSSTRKYPTVISFTEGDPLDEEAREVIPRPPLPEINRVQGRIGFDYSGILSHGAAAGNSQYVGMMIRTDITRIAGTHWNLDGYWRGRFGARSSPGQQTLQDLINRTYHLQMTYDNPDSRWVAGFGRLYLPWATSLDTIDGGYFGARLSPGATAGLFFGSTPDPTSWSYDPHRQIGGGFINFQGGSFDSFRYTSTSGAGLDMLRWKVDRPFVFFENGLFYKQFLAIYQALQADSPAGNQEVTAPGAGIGRSFITLRLQPIPRLEFDVNHTYFRQLPTFDPQLIGTGLLDKYLFQGFSFGTRVQATSDVWVYATLGRSNRSGDTKSSLNQLYGVTFARLPKVGFRADVHYSQFNSDFGTGSYESISLSRNFHENFRWEVLGGRQSFASSTSPSNSSHFVTGNLEAPLGAHYFLQSGYTWNRGSLQNYDQWYFTFGYRFDSKANRH